MREYVTLLAAIAVTVEVLTAPVLAQDTSSASALSSSVETSSSSAATDAQASSVPGEDSSSINVANIDPNAVSTVPGVVAQCQIVADAQKKAGSQSNPSAGLCIGATQVFLNQLSSGSPKLADADFDQKLTDLITALVPLAQADPACDAIDDEIARAIKLAGTYSKNKDQAAQIQSISETVAACTIDQTAALPSALVPSPNG